MDFSKFNHGQSPSWKPALRDIHSQLVVPYLREAGSHHGSTVDHGAFLPHEEPWEQVGKGTASVSTGRSLGQEAFATQTFS